ncbi:hypothetical protein ACNKHL_08920 [Shigella flexneri]
MLCSFSELGIYDNRRRALSAACRMRRLAPTSVKLLKLDDNTIEISVTPNRQLFTVSLVLRMTLPC